MNRNQWYVLAITSLILAMWFQYTLDQPTFNVERLYETEYQSEEIWDLAFFEGRITIDKWGEELHLLKALDINDLGIIVRGVVEEEIYDPFIWMFYFLFFAFLICGLLEPKAKGK